jgi:hypothetical protein
LPWVIAPRCGRKAPDASAAGGKITFRRQIERMPFVDATPVTPLLVFHF